MRRARGERVCILDVDNAASESSSMVRHKMLREGIFGRRKVAVSRQSSQSFGLAVESVLSNHNPTYKNVLG